MSRSITTNGTVMTRRQAIRRSAAWTALAGVCGATVARAETEPTGPAATRGNIRQSMAFWCFNVAGDRWDLEHQAQVAKQLGCQSVELLGPDAFDVLQRHELVCAITSNGMPGAPFATGLNNPRYQDEVIARTKEVIDANAEAGFPNVIAFTGYKWRDADDPSSGEISREEGADRCVAGLKRLAPHAEQKGVTICLEMLNTRDDTHPMKGHPGYQGDDIDYCAEIVKRVGSPRVKLLFDIYHVQVMNGDLVRRIRQYGELIGHIHTAGNPGRCELDEDQEINYPACMKALLEVGYQGYVGHEFIPTRDPLPGLVQAVSLCDV
jgi:sugar phosphate isomerase/epimerase